MLDIKKYLFVLSEEQKVNLIAEDVEMSEQEKEATMVLFESSVNEQLKPIFEDMKADFELKLAEEAEKDSIALKEKTNAYLEYVIEEWTKENKPVLHANIQGEMNQKFIEEMKVVFEENYIDIPEDRVDAHKELQDKLDKANVKFEALFDENVALKKAHLSEQKEAAFDDLTESMVDTDKERAATLLENVSAENVDEYVKKAKIILEAKFQVEDENNVTPATVKPKAVSTKSHNTLVESVLQIL